MQRLKQLSTQQRRQASARARQEQDVAMQRVKEREEVERRRRRQSPEEVFVTPRPHEKDGVSYRFTRTHCFQPEQSVGKEKVVTVIKHNREHPSAVRGEDEAEKHRERVDQKRERDRRMAEEQQETAVERGKNALDGVTSKQQGQQALEWLALVDKMERQARGQEMGGDDCFLDAGEAGGDDDRDPQRMAERAFAQMLGSDEVSVELSAFSIETDEESVGLDVADREQKDNDEIVEANAEYRAKLREVKRGGSLDLLGEKEFGRVGTKYSDGRAEATHANAENPLKAPSLGEDEHHKFQEPKNMQTDGLSFKGSERQSDDEGESEGDLSRSSIGSDKALPSVNINPYDPYRLQIDRRSSSSEVSVAQYSLPASDTKTSFDESLDQLHPGYGDDSFVNELVPMFPKRALPQPPRSFDEDSQALEEYDVQLVAPNVSRMLTSDGRTSFGRSRQCLVHQDHQEAAAIDPSRRQSETTREESARGNRLSQPDKEEFSSPSSVGSSNYELDAKSVESSMDEPLQRRKSGINQTREASTRPSVPDSQARMAESTVDNVSEISDSDSGVSSLGFAVQLNFAADTTRRRNDGKDRREAPLRDERSHGDNSSSSSFASSRRQGTKKAEKIVIPVRSSNDDDDDESTKENSLAEAFKRRHPGFGHHAESHRQQRKRQQEPERDVSAERGTKSSEATAPSPRGHVATPLPPEEQVLLDRLATGSRAKISSREMKERSCRLYHQLPEVVERKRQEEVMRRRRERLNELREQEKERRLQQKQRRQQPR